jgi:hypothetical protein
MVSVRWQAADFEQFEPESLDLGEHAVECSLVRECSGEHGVRSARLRAQAGERQTQRLAQVTAHRDLILPRLWPTMSAGHDVSQSSDRPMAGRRRVPTRLM